MFPGLDKCQHYFTTNCKSVYRGFILFVENIETKGEKILKYNCEQRFRVTNFCEKLFYVGNRLENVFLFNFKTLLINIELLQKSTKNN